MTPRELNMYAEEFFKLSDERMKNDITTAWITAYLQRVKKMPKLSKLLGQEPRNKEPQTDEQMLAVIEAMNAAFGGKVVYKKNEETGGA